MKLDSSSIYVNDVLRLSYKQSNLPIKNLTFKSERLIHLEAEQVSFNKATGTLRVKVVDYYPSNTSSFDSVPPKYQIMFLEFEKMDWQKFGNAFSGYTITDQFKNCFYNLFPIRSSSLVKKARPNPFFKTDSVPFETQKEFSFKVKFEDAKFENGSITFQAKLKSLKDVTDFRIINETLKSEFENVKPWFIKKIGKSFNVRCVVKYINLELVEINAFSKDIDSIDGEMIANIKSHQVSRLEKFTLQKGKAKSVYNYEEVVELLEHKETNLLGLSADEIIQIVISNGRAKNQKQLEYLSREKQPLERKLLFTLKPFFGFLFTVENQKTQIYIWELLNSHATYVWGKTASDSKFHETVEHEISYIQTNGRSAYKSYYKNLPVHDYKFHLIEHAGMELTEEERFQLWKNKLEALINHFE